MSRKPQLQLLTLALLLPCLQRLANNEPPLIIMYSNPKKIKLTPDGIALAAYFYKVGPGWLCWPCWACLALMVLSVIVCVVAGG